METVAVADKARVGPGRRTVLASLTFGHFVNHWYQQTFFVILPEIARDLGLGPVQVGAISGVRQIAGGAANFPAGFLADLFRRRTSLLLAIAMAWIGLAYVLVGAAPSYLVVLLGMGLVGIGAAIWHPPAIGSLSRIWAHRRGLALSVHGVGASIGDSAAPVAIGAILLVMSWRNLLQVGFVPAVLFALVVAWRLRDMHSQGEEGTSGSFLGAMKGLARNFPLMGATLASGFRSMGQIALFTFLPIYFREQLGYSPALVGLHLTLLTIMGMVSQPVLGSLSDRLGRKAALVPSLVALSGLTLLLIWARPGLPLGTVILLMGLFIYALAPIILALGMDITSKDAEGTTVGLMFGSNFLLGAASPVLAGLIITLVQFKAIFVYVAALYLIAAVIIAVLPLRKRSGSA